MPKPLAGASASPDSLSRTREKRGPGLSTCCSDTAAGVRPCLGRLSALRFAAVEPLAEREAHKAPHLDFLADLGGIFGDDFADGAGGVANVPLLHQADVAVEFFQLALDDLVEHRRRLVGGLGGIDFALLRNDFGGQLLARY